MSERETDDSSRRDRVLISCSFASMSVCSSTYLEASCTIAVTACFSCARLFASIVIVSLSFGQSFAS